MNYLHFVLVLSASVVIYAADGEVYEGDLNQDGLIDKIESDDLANYGTGGGKYLLTLSLDGVYRKYVIPGNGRFRVEIPPKWSVAKWVKIWYYWHMSSVDGYLGYSQIDGGALTQTQILISTGDGGSSLGNDMLNLVINDRDALKFSAVHNYIVPSELK